MNEDVELERPQKQQTAAVRDGRYESLFDHMVEGVALHEVVYDDGGSPVNYRIVDVNPQYEAILNLRREQVIGRLATEVYGTHASPYLKEFAEVAETGIAKRFETYFAPMDRHFEISVASWKKGSFATIFTEITGRKRMEEELRQRMAESTAINALSQRIRTILSVDEVAEAALTEITTAVDPDLAMLFLREGDDLVLRRVHSRESRFRHEFTPVHKLGECLCGLAVRDGKPIYSADILKDPRCTWEECRKAGLRSFAALPLHRGDYTFGVLGLGAGAEPRDFERQSAFLETLANQVAVSLQNAMLYDEVRQRGLELLRTNDALRSEIAERRRSEEQRAALLEQLHQAQKLDALGRLASGIAHDFSNLATVILGNTTLLRGQFKDRRDVLNSLELIEQAADEAMGLTRSLLTFSRKMPTVKRPVSLVECLARSFRLCRRLLPETIELIDDVPAGAEFRVNADATQIQQILLNLIVNARDAMPHGGTLRVRARQATKEQVARAADDIGPAESAVCLEVKDTGCGMSAEVMARIFDPFFTTKERSQGSGLGLAIVQSIVKDHQGRIEVQSKEGAGSTFSIFLPCIRLGDGPEAAAAKPVEAAEGRKLALLGEDNRHIREILASTLRARGFDVIQVADGGALMKCHDDHRRHVRLLVLDAEMPGIKGLDCLRTLRKRGSRAPAILITADALTNEIRRLPSGTRVLRKPFQLPDLERLVSEALHGRRRKEPKTR